MHFLLSCMWNNLSNILYNFIITSFTKYFYYFFIYFFFFIHSKINRNFRIKRSWKIENLHAPIFMNIVEWVCFKYRFIGCSGLLVEIKQSGTVSLERSKHLFEITLGKLGKLKYSQFGEFSNRCVKIFGSSRGLQIILN